MNCSYSLLIPKALPAHSPPQCKLPSLPTCFSKNRPQIYKTNKVSKHIVTNQKQHDDNSILSKSSLAIQVGALLTTVVCEPASAVTGVNNQEDFTWVLIQLAISAFLYFLVAPPIIMNWLRLRWYKRNLLEMYLQFNFVFMFFPALMLWAPFLNFRKFPRDPDMKNPWSVPQDPSKIRNSYKKYPWATLDDYEV